MSLSVEQLNRLVLELQKEQPYPLQRWDEQAFSMKYQGKVVGKERVRSGPNSHYTPKETRDFERAVRNQAKLIVTKEKLPIFTASVTIHLTIFDSVPAIWPQWKKKAALADYCQAWGGADLDNREKAILDALNNLVYEDDRQVVSSYKVRRYREGPEGFHLVITQTGLSKLDMANLEKLMA